MKKDYEFLTHFYAAFWCSEQAEFATYEYKGTKRPCLVPEKSGRLSGHIHVLHPPVARFLTGQDGRGALTYRLDDPLLEEVKRCAWRITGEDGDKSQAFRVSGLEATVFPSGILVIAIALTPDLEECDRALSSARTLLNKLHPYHAIDSSRKNKRSPIQRMFERDDAKQSALSRFAQGPAVVRAILGDEIILSDIPNTLLASGATSLLGDRFVTLSRLKTPWNGEREPFSREDDINLVRLARDQNERYLPVPAGLLSTYENVRFAIAGEGAACWIKPRPDQPFLQHQFEERFDTVYQSLFLLALHQRFALLNLADRVESAMPELAGHPFSTSRIRPARAAGRPAGHVRDIRREVADFYLRAFFLQPAILTNHQEFYAAVQKAFAVPELLHELETETRELDFILMDEARVQAKSVAARENALRQDHANSLLDRIGRVLHKQELAEKRGYWLSLIAEGVAIPYYAYHGLHEIMGLEVRWARGAAIAVTVAVAAITVALWQWRGPRDSGHDG